MVKARYEGEGVWQVRKNRRGVRYLAVLLTLAVMTWAAEPAAAASVSDLEREKQELERQRREADARRQQEQQNYNKAAGKADSALADDRLVAVAQMIDKTVGPGAFRGPFDRVLQNFVTMANLDVF